MKRGRDKEGGIEREGLRGRDREGAMESISVAQRCVRRLDMRT
jgi:hypothetical protein